MFFSNKFFRNLSCENQSCQWWSHLQAVKFTRFLQELRKTPSLLFYFLAALSQLENISFKSKTTNTCNTSVSHKSSWFTRYWDTVNSCRSQNTMYVDSNADVLRLRDKPKNACVGGYKIGRSSENWFNKPRWKDNLLHVYFTHW